MPRSTRSEKIFVISPLNVEGSPARTNSDRVLKYLISPVAKTLGFTIERADQILELGNINSQIIQRLVDAPLVIADMTGHNANVFYELAVRHAVNKPVVHLIARGEAIPFDVASDRAIYYELDLEGVEVAKFALESTIRSIDLSLDMDKGSSPISAAIATADLQRSSDPRERAESRVLEKLESISLRLSELSAHLVTQAPSGLGENEGTVAQEFEHHDHGNPIDCIRILAIILTRMSRPNQGYGAGRARLLEALLKEIKAAGFRVDQHSESSIRAERDIENIIHDLLEGNVVDYSG